MGPLFERMVFSCGAFWEPGADVGKLLPTLCIQSDIDQPADCLGAVRFAARHDLRLASIRFYSLHQLGVETKLEE